MAFGTTALFVYIPTRLYWHRRTRVRKALAIAAWLYVGSAMATLLVVMMGMEGAWSN